MQKVDVKYSKYLQIFNEYLDNYFKTENKIPSSLIEAMEYSVKNGGKRIRPVLCLATADMLGLDVKTVLNYALSIEFIHSYSLVHDDLPCMDDDYYRRGKLSTHKKFGEAMGVLTGDALLNTAMEIALNKSLYTQKDFEVLKLITALAGAKGMIAGQVADLENEKLNFFDEKLMIYVYENKTSKLIEAPILTASILSDNKYFKELQEYGYKLGILFQVTDDILDVTGTLESIGKTPNKDEKSNKMTAVAIYGLDGAKDFAKKLFDECKNILKDIPNSQFLQDFTDKIYFRKN